MKFPALLSTLVVAGASTSSNAQTQTDRFDLLCKSTAVGEAADLKLNVFIFVDGAEVTNTGISPPVEYKAGIYVNALTWTDGTFRYEANRFTGVLKVSPGAQTFNCEKIGGKKF